MPPDSPLADSLFPTKPLGTSPDSTAPDGTAVRLLLTLSGGSMAHFELPAGAVSHAVTHRTVEEVWYVLSGEGALWRRHGGAERIEALAPGTAVAIPLGTAFQFRAEAGAPLAFLAITMPPWPGIDEALPAAGPWTPTVPAGA
jgi:mannose-6-phosphate isomerase-like protein (cupin superfamily)